MRGVVLILLGVGPWWACGCADQPFTAVERAALEDLRLMAAPADPTNRFADDPAAARLGHQLFFDPRLSGPLQEVDDDFAGALGEVGDVGKVSCSSCHDPAAGGADRRSRGPTSIGAGWTGRNAPTVLNASLSRWMFWDGRKDTEWSQALAPLESDVEHNISRLALAQVMFTVYRQPYEDIFGPMPPLDDAARFPADGRPGDPAWEAMAAEDQQAVDLIFANVGKAIAAYERGLVDVTSPFDRFMAGDASAMSDAAVRGARLFVGRASCNECHSGPLLADGRFHNHGIAQAGATVPLIDEGRAAALATLLADPFNGKGAFSDDVEVGAAKLAEVGDEGPGALGAFKTPTLRNVSQSAPYMHTGGFVTLWDAVEWYRRAAGTDGFVGERAAEAEVLRLSDEDVNDLVAFLLALDGEGIDPELLSAPELP